jgi:hypothetical protein
MTSELKPITENDFGKQILELARLLGWKSAHFRPAQTAHGWRTAVQGDGKGWPDWVLVRPPRIILAELKREQGKTSTEQDEWLALLRKCPTLEVYLWRPSELERIAEILR